MTVCEGECDCISDYVCVVCFFMCVSFCVYVSERMSELGECVCFMCLFEFVFV